jgi:hypothetical protein
VAYFKVLAKHQSAEETNQEKPRNRLRWPVSGPKFETDTYLIIPKQEWYLINRDVPFKGYEVKFKIQVYKHTPAYVLTAILGFGGGGK